MAVVIGETEWVPAATGVTGPILLLMLKVVAFVVAHERTEEEPVVIEIGFAVSTQVGAAGGGGA